VAISQERPEGRVAAGLAYEADTGDRHVQELDWLGYVAAAMLRQQHPDDVAVAAVSAIADVVKASHARIFRIVGKEYRHVGDCVEGQTQPSHEGALPSVVLTPPIEALRRYRSGAVASTRSGDVIPICFDSEVLAVVHVNRAAVARLDPVERMLLDRVASIAGAALRSAERLQAERERAARLEDLERAKSQFLSLASHELRGPMTVLMGYLSLLEDGAFGEVPDAFMRTLPVLNARIAEMEGLINAMLETSRLEDNRVDLERSLVDIRELADESLRRCEVFAHSGQFLSLRCCDSAAHVYVDRTRMIVAIANLINNAIKYSVRHTDVRCVVRADDRYAYVDVTDEGVGIALEDQAKLFTRFGRLRNDPAVAGIPGTGLGLYLSREFARMHGGDITVQSAPGVGSTFTLTLPLAT
jgi:signal transduction histidine kinase